MSYPYGMAGAPVVGKGLGGLPRRGVAKTSAGSSTIGTLWTPCVSAGARNWRGLYVSDNGNIIAAGVSGSNIWISLDGGANWTQQTGCGTAAWSICGDSTGSKIYAAGNSSSWIKKSTDYGATWANVGFAQRSVESIACSADGGVIAVLYTATTVDVSVDSGATWNAYSIGGSSSPKSISVSADGSRMACIDGTVSGNVYVSSNSGATWSVVSPPIATNGSTVVTDGTTIIASWYSSGAYKSADFGSTWGTCVLPTLGPTKLAANSNLSAVIATQTSNYSSGVAVLASINNSFVIPMGMVSVSSFAGAASKSRFVVAHSSSGYIYTSP